MELVLQGGFLKAGLWMEYIGYFIAFFAVIGSVWGAFAKVRSIEKAFDKKIEVAFKESKGLGDRIKGKIQEYDKAESEKRTLRAQKYDQQFKDHAEEVDRFIKKQVITDSELNGPDGIYAQMGELKTNVDWLKRNNS